MTIQAAPLSLTHNRAAHTRTSYFVLRGGHLRSSRRRGPKAASSLVASLHCRTVCGAPARGESCWRSCGPVVSPARRTTTEASHGRSLKMRHGTSPSATRKREAPAAHARTSYRLAAAGPRELDAFRKRRATRGGRANALR